jgi:hypothetical protein
VRIRVLSERSVNVTLQEPVAKCRSQSVVARLCRRVTGIGGNEQLCIEKHLLCFALRDAVPFVLAGVALVPLEADDARPLSRPAQPAVVLPR